MHIDKSTSVAGITTRRPGGGAPSGQSFEVTVPDAAAILQFFQKIRSFRHILAQISAENAFLNAE